MSLKMRKLLATPKAGINCFGTGNPKRYVTVHQTGNTSRGANAQMHAMLQRRGFSASWHWQVDDKEAVQSFEHNVKCWHASDGEGPGNTQSIAVEICINSDGNYRKSVENGAKLVAYILHKEGLGVNKVYQHNHWDKVYRKNCPAQIRAGKDGINWNKFLQMVENELAKLKGTKPQKVASSSSKKSSSGWSGIEKSYRENGIFYMNETILVSSAPRTTNRQVVARYYAGESVRYHTVHIGNGYVWLQYTSSSGVERYIPCRTYNNGRYGKIWGTIK